MTAKILLRKALHSDKDLYMAILHYRNTPTQGMDSSPAQRLMNKYFNDDAKDLTELGKGDTVRMKPLPSGDEIWKKTLRELA